MSEDQHNPIPELTKKDDDRGGVFGWLYRWYDRYDTWSGRWDWLMGFIKANTAASVATTGAAAVAVTGAVVITNPDLRDRWFPPAAIEKPVAAIVEQPKTIAEEPKTDVKVATQRWGSSVVFPIEGKDLTLKRAAFDVAVLPTDLAWARKSSTELVQGGASIAEDEAAARIFSAELRDGLSRSVEVIAVGLASQEGQRAEETERAKSRAASAARWLSSAVDASIPIWTLNLGQFRGTCKATNEAADTGWQRPVIIVGIRSQETGVNLTEAFADAISGKSNLPSRDCYTNFDLARFR
jgi:hypothetical protein